MQTYIDAVVKYLSTNSFDSFKDECGIKAKSDGNHIILDYDMLNVNWDQPYGYVCRGLVLSAKNYEVLCFGLPKFFNFNEGRAESIDWDSAFIYEKLDGTMVNRWWSPPLNKFVYTTRRQLPQDISGNSVLTSNHTWEHLIEKAVRDLPLEKQSKDETWTIEVVSPINKVVVTYKETEAKVIAVRNNKTLNERDLSFLDSSFVAKRYSFNSIDDCVDFANESSGKILEGFVVSDKDFNRVKIKGKGYLSLHHLKSSAGSSLKALISVVKNNEVSELVSAFPEYSNALSQIKKEVDSWASRHEQVYDELKDISSQKDFALEVQSRNLESPSLLFSIRAGKYKSIKEASQAMNENAFVKAILPLVENHVSLI